MPNAVFCSLLLIAAPCAFADRAFAGPVAAPADLPPAETVIAVIDNHPTVAAAGAKVGAARASANMLRRGPEEFHLAGSVARRRIDGEGTLNDFDATISRPFRLPGKATLDRRSGELGVDVAVNRLADHHHQTARLLADLWYAWLAAASHHRNDLGMVGDLDKAHAAMQRRVDLRDAAEVEMDQARSALALAQTEAAVSLAEREQAHARLTATFPDLQVPADAPEPATPLLDDSKLAALRDAVIEHSHEILAAAKEAERLETIARRVRADRMADPTFGVRLFSERSGTETGAGIVASLPFGGSYRRAAAEQSSAEANAARLEVAATERLVQADANTDLANARTRFAAWQRAEQAAKSATDASARIARGHQLGQLDLADMLYARRLVSESRRREIDARAAANLALTRLLIDSHNLWFANDPDHP